MRASPAPASRQRSLPLAACLLVVTLLVGVFAPVAGSAAEAAEPDLALPVTVLASDFEDGTTQGWAARGGETVAVDGTAARTGDHGLAVTDRTAGWEGPALRVDHILERGVAYTVSLWVRLAEGAESDTARLSLERRVDGTTSYHTLGSVTVGPDAWVQLTGTHTPTVATEYSALYVETAAGTASFGIDDVLVTRIPVPPIQRDIPALRDALPEFPIGAAVSPADIHGERAELLARHHSSLTPGNALKWDATQPAEGVFRFTDADPILDFAAERGMAVRGHTLVWHEQTPAWVFTGADGEPMTPTPENKALLLERLETHIREVVGRYGDRIETWDVVNEVIDENRPDGMRRSPWYEITGLDYIRTAFRVAHEVAPDARLVINDYNTNVPAKREALYELVALLLEEGVPVHGVGHQTHINIEWPSVAEARAMLERFVPLGVDQEITELDVSVYTAADQVFPVVPAERLEAQARQYRRMFDLFRSYSEHIASVTVWGLADDDTWLDGGPLDRKDAPLLFDERLRAKAAYWAIVDPGWEGGIGPSGGCLVDHLVTDRWPGGFRAEITVLNTGSRTIDGWALGWTMDRGERIDHLWNGTLVHRGPRVTVGDASWNAVIPPRASVSLGYLGSRSGAPGDGGPVEPTFFTLDDRACLLLAPEA
ncbi:endo-1,4-beta-xylanase [Streptomyces alkaliphilus]|uniref:endo-1,4-beta-xylanase n=1 Tax=Streptomyces alkaliphilus TaxID=1472722 RepID=UPI00117DF96D|nr:endo-1,4-beta-xylanase [Streptomyces alkaliphilus]MQS08033.1 glycosyl hydrolase [Streptomyces alkaliphilus]